MYSAMQMPPAAITHMMMLAGITSRPIDSKPETSPASPRPVSRKPRKSSGKISSSRMFGMYHVTSMIPIIPIGTLMKKIQRHE
jgi:hypothetical protein